MAKYIVQGGKPLKGTIKVSGNKNAILPVMAASILTREKSVLTNVPQIQDVKTMAAILTDIGVKVAGVGTDRLVIDPSGINKYTLDPDLVSRLRASILLLGPLLARFRKARMRHPGGCIIGRRAVGTHFDALFSLGAEIRVGEENYEADAKELHSGNIFLDEASVTATENAIMAAVLIPGTTIIEDAACEPHVVDLANYLNAMGGKVEGAGTNRILVTGVGELNGASHEIVSDHIDVGTFIIAAATTRGEILIEGVDAENLKMILLVLGRMGVRTQLENGNLRVLTSRLIAPKEKIQTRPWPGFPTDLMSPLIVLATQAKGISLCHEWMYESRMFFVDKLITMGANITICDPHRVLVAGPTRLKGKRLESPDIRAGMALVIAALGAEGESVIEKVELIERGYENIESRLKTLGANIRRAED